MKKKLSIIGGGPAGMMLACHINRHQYDVTIYEKNKTLGRKFLVAGKGGFNLTHSEPIEQLILRYFPNYFLQNALNQFSNSDLVKWLNELKIPTFIGTSKRIFPLKGIKPAFVLSQFIRKIQQNGAKIQTSMKWNGWDEQGHLIFNDNISIQSDITVFALGGGSWKKTGSDGQWISHFQDKMISTLPFSTSNAALQIKWNSELLDKIEGKPLKNIRLCSNSISHLGDITISREGIEGSPAYALNNTVRAQLQKHEYALVSLDFKPSLSVEDILNKLIEPRKKSWSSHIIHKIKIPEEALILLKNYTTKSEFIDPKTIAQRIKTFPLRVDKLAPIDEAISTVGGITLNAVNEHFELINLKNHFVIGEMLDWDAPTGGYLLQACFSSGVYLANYLNNIDD